MKNIFRTYFQKIQVKSQLDTTAVWVTITAALSLTFIKYFGNYEFLRTGFQSLHWDSLLHFTDSYLYRNNNHRLYQLLYWSGILILFYFFVPVLIIKLALKEKLSAYGIRLKGAFKDYKLYLLMLVVMVPLILFFSTTSSFQSRYPFYQPGTSESLYPNLVIWEVFYIAQFFALEFFFRGFMLYSLEKVTGYYSVFIMMIPYCMIHFGKPLPETLGAIAAGIILGTLSLKSRSIIPGFLLHVGVALSMDFAALYQKGYF